MGTAFEIFIAAQEESYARKAAAAVFDEIDRLEHILSRFDPRSDVGLISRLESGLSLQVGIELIECLRIAAEAYLCTAGAFDVTLGSLLDNPERGNDKNKSRAASHRIGFNRFYFAKNGAVFFDARPAPHIGGAELTEGAPLTITIIGEAAISSGSGFLKLDFGGIGKGYALDKSLEILADWDIEHALLHGGSSTALAIGDSPENLPQKKGWPVGTAGERFYLQQAALSGSGKEVKGEHILDPETGKPATGHLSAWVSHPSAAMADALSTAFIVMSREEVVEFCRNNPYIWAKVVESPGAVKIYNPQSR
jgi:thiamine biosynthesis lipoprotein